MSWDAPDASQAFNPVSGLPIENGMQAMANLTPHFMNAIKSIPEKLKEFANFDPVTSSWLFGGFAGMFMMFAVSTAVQNSAFLNKSALGAFISPILKIALPLLTGFATADWTTHGFNDFGGAMKRTTNGFDRMLGNAVKSVTNPTSMPM